MTLYFLTLYAIHKGAFRAAGHVILGICAISVLFLVVPALHHILFEDILRLHETGRGLGSGFTGRSELWAAALNSFWRRPVFGYGFRTGGFGAHSGYIKLLAEMGLVGFIPVVGSVVIEAVRRFRLATRFRDMPQAAMPMIDIKESFRVNSIACATIVLMLAFWVFEQLYINLGSVISIVFFMMLVAPPYVVRKGANTR
jgi:O-antigen ligase